MKKIIILIILIVAGYFGWQLLRPVFIDDQINEELPEEFSAFVIPTEDEFMSMSDSEKEEAEIKMVEMFKDKGVEVSEEMPAMDTPVWALVGEFVGKDNFHKGSGKAKIFQAGSDQLLRFEDFSVTNGPDLHVILSSHENPSKHDDFGEYIDLGKLKGNVGDQNYELSGVDISKYNSVVIYCEPFSVVFATASLK
jgi:hypothetical protein